MVYSSQNAAFRKDKQQFFSQIVTTQGLDSKIKVAQKRIETIGYTFLLQNQQALETEFNQMFAVLKKSADENNEAFWLYLFYCASLLEAFHKAYSQSAKEKEFAKLKEKIQDRLNNETEIGAADDDFIESLRQKFSANINGLVTFPFHLSKIRDNVAYTNLCRIYWLFCRLTLTQGLNIARDLKLIDKLDILLGTHTDVDKIISAFKAPTGVINYFSVGLFLARFLIDGGLLIKHTLFPIEEEKGAGTTTRFDRFKHELYKRHCNFANDLVWATVNFLTNFNHITHISDPVAGYLTAVFLTFDVCMIIYKCHLAKQEYLVKKSQYQQEREDYLNPKLFTSLTDKQKLAQVAMLDRQLTELEIDWHTKEAASYFNAIAAAMLATGFTSSLLLSSPILVLACFFVCQIAVAMYLSGEAYSQYKEKSLYLEQAELTGTNLSVAQKEYENTRNEFIFTMVKNAVVPMVLIATFAVCWPAALVLSALYVGYEAYHAFSQHSGRKEVNQLALGAPEFEDDQARLFILPA